MASRTTKIAGIAVIAALALTGCGKSAQPSTGSEPSGSMSSMDSMGGTATTSAGADLRASLTYLLTEHVYRAGIALKFAVDKGGNLDDPTVKAAVANLDANSVELSKAVGGAYPDAAAPFLQSWRQHIGFFVDYTLGRATNDQTKVDKARTDLDGYRTAFGQLINSVVPQLPAAAVADELKPHVQTLTDAIDSLVAGDGQVFAKLQTAAGHMPMTAKTLATGIAANKQLTGDPNGAASELRSGMTYLLTSHVDLAGIAIVQAVAKGGNLTEPSVKAAISALDANSVQLSKAVGAAYPDAEAPFLQSWRQHIGFFVDYTLGRATKDQAKVDKARTDLDGYRTAFGQLINSVVPQLPAAAVADELKPHVQTLTDAIDALVAGDPTVFTKLATAASHMPMTAATLAGGIASNKKLS